MACFSRTPRPQISLAPGSPSMEGGMGSELCDCTSSMLSLLVESEIDGDRVSLRTTDRFVRLNKHRLARCYRVLECQACSSKFEFDNVGHHKLPNNGVSPLANVQHPCATVREIATVRQAGPACLEPWADASGRRHHQRRIVMLVAN